MATATCSPIFRLAIVGPYAIGATIARTWQIVTRLCLAVILGVSAVYCHEKAPGHSTFISPLQYLGGMGIPSSWS
jgi:hypothetical protein